MKRFFGKIHGEKIILDEDETFHMSKVLRMAEGEKVVACVNDEYDYLCEIEKIGKNNAILHILEKNLCEATPKKEIVLFQMMPKKEYFDAIIAKSVELGVTKIVPFVGDFCTNKDFRRDRVESQIKTACKQCERSILPTIDDIVKFEKLPEMLKNFDVAIFAYENETRTFEPKMLKNAQKIAIIVGNEAGFSKKRGRNT